MVSMSSSTPPPQCGLLRLLTGFAQLGDPLKNLKQELEEQRAARAKTASAILRICEARGQRGRKPGSGAHPLSNGSSNPNAQSSRSGKRRTTFAAQPLDDLDDTIGELGGRVVELPDVGALGTLECVLFDPIGKRLDPSGYESSGVVICLDGMPFSDGKLKEWGRSVDNVGWLKLGFSVALPSVQMSSALTTQDLISVVDACLKKMGAHDCILVGKGWGGLRAAEVAADPASQGRVAGLVLVAPSSPAPVGCRTLQMPIQLLWAHDDDVSAFSECEGWIEALDGRCAPTTCSDSETGKHRLDHILQDDESVTALRNFAVSVQLLASLAQEKTEANLSSTGARLSARTQRLSMAMPQFLQGNEHATSNNTADAIKRLSDAIPDWINSGMPNSSE